MISSIREYKKCNYTFLVIFFSVVFSLIMPSSASAEVPIQYHSWFGYDQNIPGVPSPNKSDYVQELKYWALTNGIDITTEMANTMISQPSPIVFEKKETGELYLATNEDVPVWELMRDIVFLETAQKSIQNWNDRYINSLGRNDSLVASEAFNRSKRIMEEYERYVKDCERNPLDLVILAYCENYEARINYGLGKAKEIAIDSFFSGEIKIEFGLSDVVSILLQDVVKALNDSGNQSGKQFASLIEISSTGAFAVLGGYASVILAPAEILNTIADTLITTGTEEVKGAHLMLYYYYSKILSPESFSELIDPNTGRITRDKLTYLGVGSSAIQSDPIALRMYDALSYQGHNLLGLSLDTDTKFATDEDIKAVYATASLMRAVEGLDLNKLKSGLVKYLANQHNSGLIVNRTNNVFDLNLPISQVNNIDHGEVSSIYWRWTSNNGSYTGDLIQEAFLPALSNQVMNNNNVTALTVSINEVDMLKQGGTIDVTLTYPDGYIKTGSAKLNYLPEHNVVSFVSPPNAFSNADEFNYLRLSIDGDTPQQATLFRKNNQTGITYYSNVELVQESDNNYNYDFFFIPSKLNIESYQQLDYGYYTYWVKVDSTESNKIQVSVVDPKDLDIDGVLDEWEKSFFENISTYSGSDDPDNDGKDNYTEWVLGTDPLKTGIEEILITTTIDNDYSGIPSGDIYQNIVIESGNYSLNGRTTVIHGNLTINNSQIDLSGGHLIVEGNLIQSGSYLNINGGATSITGDYILENYVMYGWDHGSTLSMKNDNDRVTVGGNFWMDSSAEHTAYLTGGTLEIEGNFTQQGQYNNFNASGTHKVILSGTALQTVSLEDPGYSRFNILENRNSSSEGVVFATPIALNSFISSGHTNDIELVMYSSWVLQHDEVIEGDLKLNSSSVDLNGHTLTVNGNCDISNGSSINQNGGNLSVEGNYNQSGLSNHIVRGQLTVGGNLIQSGSYLNINGGTTSITGDYILENYVMYGWDHGSTLSMTNDNDRVTVGCNFRMDSLAEHTNYLIAGTLEIKGNFTQQGGYNNFNASGTHKVILAGTALQTVSLEDPGYSRFNTLENRNSSSEGVIFATPIAFNSFTSSGHNNDLQLVMYSNWTLQHDETIDGELRLNSSSVDLNGYTLTVNGNCDISNGSSIDQNGGQLIVKGNLIQSGSYLNINGGATSITGDYILENYVMYGWDHGSTLSMKNDNDRVTVGGNFWMDSSAEHTAYLTGGTLEIEGNFTQQGGYNNFNASGTHKVILSGTALQTVSLEDPGYSRFNTLENRNSSSEGVFFATPIALNSFISSGHTNDIELVMYSSWVLQHDEVIEGDLKLNSSSVDLNGHTLTVNGNCDISNGSSINQNGGQFIVEGNLIQSGSYLNINGGTTSITGDYIIENYVMYGWDHGSTLSMTNDNDRVTVGGNFRMDSSAEHTAYLTGGTLEIEGNFTQQGQYNNFNASGTHKVILSGTALQTVSLEDPGYSRFNTLENRNSSSEGVIFATPIAFNSFTSSGHNNDLQLVMYSNWTLQHDETIDGELKLNGSSIDLNGHTLTVNGNCDISNGSSIDQNGGQLSIEGDLVHSNGNDNVIGGNEITISGKLVQSGGTLNLNNILLRINGDIDLSSGTLNLNNSTLILYNGEFFNTGGTLLNNGSQVISASKKDIISFSFPNQLGEAEIEAANHMIKVIMPYDTDFTNLVANFTLSWGAKAYIGEVAQESGFSANNFTNPLTYIVQAYDGSTCEWVVTVEEDLPPKPTGLIADELTFSSVTLTWDALPGVASYKIYRAIAEEGPYTELGTTDQNGYTDNTVNPGTTYWFKVSALKNSKEGPLSDAVSVTTFSPSIVQLESNSYDVAEEDGSITINVIRSGNLDNTVTVSYATQDNTAIQGQDYLETTGTVTFEPNETTQSLVVPIINDNVYEQNEIFHLSLLSPSIGTEIGAINEAVITIQENDILSTIGFESNNIQVGENTGTLEINLVRTGNSDIFSEVEFYTETINATTGLDYEETGGSVAFEPGETLKTINLSIIDNDVMDRERTFKIILANPYESVLSSYSELEITIKDDDSEILLNENGENEATTWQNEPQGKWVRTSERSYSGDYSWMSPAEANADYSLTSPAFSLKDSTSAVLLFTHWYHLELLRDWGIVEIITDDDSIHGLKMYNSFSDWQTETIDLSNYCGQENLRIRFRIFTDSSITLEGWCLDDITVLSGIKPPKPEGLSVSAITTTGLVLTWDEITNIDGYNIYRAESDSGPFTLIATNDENSFTDSGLDPAKEYWYQVSGNKNGVEGLLSDALNALTIGLDKIQFSITSYNASEAEDSISIEVIRNSSLSGTVSVDYTTMDGTATHEQDFIATTGTFTFGPEETSKIITVPLINDNLYEQGETFYLTLSNPSTGAELGDKIQAVITIAENDYMESTGTISYLNFEGGFLGIVLDDRQKYRPINQPRKVKDGDIINFKWIDAGNIVGFQMWGKPIRLLGFEVVGNVSQLERKEPELDILPIDNPTGPKIPNPTRPDNLIIQFDNESYTVKESSPEILVTVTRTGSNESPCSIEYTTSPITAEENIDYEGLSGVITFTQGESHKEITIKVLSDDLQEGTEQFKVTLSDPTKGASLGSQTEATVEIEDATQQSIGTVQYIEANPCFYGIITEEGEKLFPIELPRQYAKDGLGVRFVWQPIEDKVSPVGWGKMVKVIEMSQDGKVQLRKY